MNANELRVGITLNIFDPKIAGFNPVTIDKDRLIALITGEETSYFPIPLTPEILGKARFYVTAKKNLILWFAPPVGNVFLIYNSEMGEYRYPRSDGSSTVVSYLHHLQNLYFDLYGEELKLDYKNYNYELDTRTTPEG